MNNSRRQIWQRMMSEDVADALSASPTVKSSVTSVMSSVAKFVAKFCVRRSFFNYGWSVLMFARSV